MVKFSHGVDRDLSISRVQAHNNVQVDSFDVCDCLHVLNVYQLNSYSLYFTADEIIRYATNFVSLINL